MQEHTAHRRGAKARPPSLASLMPNVAAPTPSTGTPSRSKMRKQHTVGDLSQIKTLISTPAAPEPIRFEVQISASDVQSLDAPEFPNTPLDHGSASTDPLSMSQSFQSIQESFMNTAVNTPSVSTTEIADAAAQAAGNQGGPALPEVAVLSVPQVQATVAGAPISAPANTLSIAPNDAPAAAPAPSADAVAALAATTIPAAPLSAPAAGNVTATPQVTMTAVTLSPAELARAARRAAAQQAMAAGATAQEPKAFLDASLTHATVVGETLDAHSADIAELKKQLAAKPDSATLTIEPAPWLDRAARVAKDVPLIAAQGAAIAGGAILGTYLINLAVTALRGNDAPAA